MKERPIIFNAEMVRAILDGRKTQTRRPIKTEAPIQTSPAGRPLFYDKYGRRTQPKHQFGSVGDRLWVRETWYQYGHHCMPMWDGADAEDAYWSGQEKAKYAATDEVGNGRVCFGDYHWRKRPSIHMSRWASRILLEITNIRVERLWDITEPDILAEGITERFDCNLRGQFKHLWDSIYGDGIWDHNGWVWVIEFKRVEA